MINWQEKFSYLRKQRLLFKARQGLFRRNLRLFSHSISVSKKEIVFVYETSKLHGKARTESREMFKKMIDAMNISSSDHVVLEFSKEDLEDKHFSQNFSKQVCSYNPNIVVCFGSFSSGIFLGKNQRLGQIHGQFFVKSFSTDTGEYSMKIVPIFHPDFLCINPNMKRPAWLDLKKVMAAIDTT